MSEPIEDVLAGVGERLRRLRREREVTLSALAESTGISVSTLSRLESGKRRPSLELLLPLAQAYQVPLDELVGAPEVGDPRVRLRPQKRGDLIVMPLTRRPGGIQAFKMIHPERPGKPEPKTHEGYEWLYVLNGRLRLILGDRDLVLEPGEAAEFDTRLPHWFAGVGGPVEVLCLMGPQGERLHMRAQPRRK
ncbi:MULTISPECIES: helix-turn-helix domain-containing protein [Actinomadura]|uniref:helix-turn-helix domain-containing protein n=1 Tax=Actinomadura TaxID=1988 RepID=UPI0004090EDB|nr:MULTISPECIES: XRE family transcriptional regulator [Actinomadura]RSN69969.1 XRE family transcriptional regulator [Actinomadura sp. WAC 06369]